MQVINHLIFSFFLIFTSVVNASEPPSVQELLTVADSIRSSDPKRLVDLVVKIRERQSKLTPEQNASLSYFEGYARGYSGDQQGAIDKYLWALNNTQNKQLIYRLSLSMANTYALMRNWYQGLVSLEKALLIGNELGTQDTIIESALVAAIFYNQLGQYELALSYVERLFPNKLQGRNRCIALHLELEAKVKLNEINSKSDKFTNGAKYCLQISETLIANFIYINQIKSLISENKYAFAADLLDSNFPDILNTQYKLLIAETYALKAETLLRSGQTTLASEHAIKALLFSEDSKFSQPAVQALRILFEIKLAEKNFEDAIKFQKKYVIAERAYLNDQTSKQLAYQRTRMEVLEKNQQIANLNQKNQVLQLQEKLTRETSENRRLFVYLMIVIASSLVLWTYNLKRNQARLKKLAEFDGLTGLNNRRHFNESAESLLKYCNGEGQEASFIMFDLDKFKLINDTYGHLVGDWVLKQTANAIKKQGRKNDLIGRIGGEEFAIILPACGIEEGRNFAQQCRQAIEAIDTTDSGHKFVITASFGVTCSQLSNYELKQLMYDSDLALYQAKENGRNQVVCWKPPAEVL